MKQLRRAPTRKQRQLKDVEGLAPPMLVVCSGEVRARLNVAVCTVVFTDATLDVASEARRMSATLTLLD
jgi:hypothetical protein